MDLNYLFVIIVPIFRNFYEGLAEICFNVFTILVWFLFGIRKYVVTDKFYVDGFLEMFQEKSSTIVDNTTGPSIIIDRKAIISVSYSLDRKADSRKYVSIWTTSNNYKFLKHKIESSIHTHSLVNDREDSSMYSFYMIFYNSCEFMYNKRLIFNERHTPRNNQGDCVDRILSTYRSKNHATAFIHGTTCTGKTSVAYLVSQSFKNSLVYVGNSSNPYSKFDEIYTAVYRESINTDPIIIILDEIDICIRELHKNSISSKHEDNNNITTASSSTLNKPSWNRWLDNISIGLYPKLIVIMTSNTLYNEICSLDPSYLRNGRVDVICEMENNILEKHKCE